MASKKNYIDEKAMGADFCWSFGDGDADACKLPRDVVRQLFSDLGFDPLLIDEVNVSDALNRARHHVRRGDGIVIKELKSPNKDTPKAFGVYQVQAVQGESGDKIVCGARVRVQTGSTVACLPPEGHKEIAECMVVGEEMKRITEELCSNVYNRDLSQAILSVGNGLGWISRRRNLGGVYYLHRQDAERLAELLKGIEKLTSHNHRSNQFVPHITEQYNRPLTLESWSGAARDHYEAKVSQLVKDLDRVFKDGNMREKTIIDRADECNAIMAEANRYAIFMKTSLLPLEERLKKIRATFLKANAEGAETIEKDLKAIEKLIGIAPVKKSKEKTVEETVEEDKSAKRKKKLEQSDFEI